MLLCEKIVPSSEKFKGQAVLLKVHQELFYAKKSNPIAEYSKSI
jgi:hypothetical protein